MGLSKKATISSGSCLRWSGSCLWHCSLKAINHVSKSSLCIQTHGSYRSLPAPASAGFAFGEASACWSFGTLLVSTCRTFFTCAIEKRKGLSRAVLAGSVACGQTTCCASRGGRKSCTACFKAEAELDGSLSFKSFPFSVFGSVLFLCRLAQRRCVRELLLPRSGLCGLGRVIFWRPQKKEFASGLTFLALGRLLEGSSTVGAFRV